MSGHAKLGERTADQRTGSFGGVSPARPLTPSDVQAALDQQRAMARRYGTLEDMAAEGFRRNLTIRDGQAWLRPLPHVQATLQTALTDLDIIPVYRQVKCPLLVALATDDLPEQQPFQELYAAYRRGLESRPAEARDANPCLRVACLRVARVEGATHAMVAERPAEIARLIRRFAAPAATGARTGRFLTTDMSQAAFRRHGDSRKQRCK